MLHDDPMTELEPGGRPRERLRDCAIAYIGKSRFRNEP